MKRLTRNHSIFAMDKQNHPVLYVDSGERFVVETEDCFSHQIVESDDVLNDNFDYYGLILLPVRFLLMDVNRVIH